LLLVFKKDQSACPCCINVTDHLNERLERDIDYCCSEGTWKDGEPAPPGYMRCWDPAAGGSTLRCRIAISANGRRSPGRLPPRQKALPFFPLMYHSSTSTFCNDWSSPMIASVIAATLMMAPATNAVAVHRKAYAAQRKAYNDCLEEFAIKGIESKMEVAAFESAVATACSGEATALRQAAVGTSKAAGRKPADGEEMVTDDIAEYQENAKYLFRDFKEKGSKPTP
jgi:hypothetical protein